MVRNALYKVIKLKDAGQLGDKVVVQGGTFLNDAVLRAFELQTGAEVIRPDIAGLMGAFGAALTAQRNWSVGERSSVLSLEEVEAFRVSTQLDTCKLCQNHCQLTISSFTDGGRHVSGNRCERGASTETAPKKSEIPNLFDYKYRRMFGYRRLTEDKAPRGEIGIPRVLNMYENYPLWFTILSHLGFRVSISGRSSHEVFEAGMESIPSENTCYPAKLAHGHVEHLLDKGIRTIFYPCIPLEAKETAGADNHFNCPVVAFYPQVIEKNLTRLQDEGVRFLAPMLNLNHPAKLAERLVEVFADWNVTLAEARAAVQAGYEEDAAVKADVRAEGQRALAYIAEHGIKGIVLAGRPYHVDPEVHHGIPSLITTLGMAVFTEDSIIDAEGPGLERPIRVRDQWAYHTRLYEAAGQVASNPELQLVQLTSFGCGVDAITTDQVAEVLERTGGLYTLLKIDEVSNLGAATIRLRSLKAAAAERGAPATVSTFGPLFERRIFDETARGHPHDLRPADGTDSLPVGGAGAAQAGHGRPTVGEGVRRRRRGRAEVRPQRRVLPGDHGGRAVGEQDHLRRGRPRSDVGRDHPDRRDVPGDELREPAAQGAGRCGLSAGAGAGDQRAGVGGQLRLQDDPGDHGARGAGADSG